MLIHFYLPHKNTKRISSPWLKIAINANQTRKRLHDNFQGARRETKQVPKIYRARLRAYILSELIFYILFFIYCHVLQFLLTPLKPFNINGFSDLVISQIHPRCSVIYPSCSFMYPRCSVIYPPCSFMHPPCSFMHPQCSVMHPSCKFTQPKLPILETLVAMWYNKRNRFD